MNSTQDGPPLESQHGKLCRSINRHAAFIMTVLPDSLRLRREVLDDLLAMLDYAQAEHPLRHDIARRLDDLDACVSGQMELSMKFEQLAQKQP